MCKPPLWSRAMQQSNERNRKKGWIKGDQPLYNQRVTQSHYNKNITVQATKTINNGRRRFMEDKFKQN